jgi:hypothetical protein
LLIIDFIDFFLQFLNLFVKNDCLLGVELELAGILLEAGSEEKLAIADTASTTHPTLPLYLTQCQVFEVFHYYCVLVGKYAQFVSTTLTSFVSTELTRMFMALLKFFVTDNTLGFIWVVSLSSSIQFKNTI